MTNKVELECVNCGEKFLRLAKTAKRDLGLNRNVFCSRSCSSKHNSPKIEWKPTEKRLTQLASITKTTNPFNWYLTRAKSNTVLRGKRGTSHEFDIDAEYLEQLWKEQHGKCAISGIELELRYNKWKQKHISKPNQASLDRIDNSKGYIKGNVRFVCLMANYALSTFSDDDLLNFCRSVVQYNSGS